MIDFERAKLAPGSVFSTSEGLSVCPDLILERKIELLRHTVRPPNRREFER